MGGKSYFCDYCRCYMKNDKNVRKTHNEGLAHKIVKANIMRKYEDPRKLYDEESKKQPCTRYFKSYCKYDLYCQYTHLNETQLRELKILADNLNTKSQTEENTTKQCVKDATKLSSTYPWKNRITKNQKRLLPKKLPPSLRPLKLKKLRKIVVGKNNWGE
ncbi:zinc finger matrin-type protein 5 [Cochliomyia hominivorax]